jgi:GT2 family glycosyltransferase
VRAQHAGDVVVAIDGPPDQATEDVAHAHRARVVMLGRHLGINAARNRAAALATGDLLAFLDDDVELWPRWRDALTTAARIHPDADCFGGPIRPRLEGPAPRGCGRPQDAPVTALDLGPADRPADFAWGANFAVRRAALERVGPFDETINHCGDEEDWQRRLKAAGGSVFYVARAGVDHRRTGDDARLHNLARAAYRRGRAARRYDARKGTAPSGGAEARVLAGTVLHVVRHRCPAGLVPVAHTLGRLRERLTSG